jgi:hypothetical protein
MPYRLHNGVYSVRCRHAHCPFNAQMKIEQTIMGMTEADVENEARKVARDMAVIAHDSIRVRQHSLHNPEIRRSSGSCQLVGTGSGRALQPSGALRLRDFSRGECILKEGERADCVCEVLRGSAYPEGNKSHGYRAGDCFGASALLPGHTRMTSIVCRSDGTRIAFHNLVELNRSDPRKAKRVFARLMEDTLLVIRDLEKRAG